MPDAVTLNAGQRQALEAVVSENAESRRAVKLLIVQAYCGAKDADAQDRVAEAVGHLCALGLVRIVARGLEPTPEGIHHCRPAPAAPAAPAAPGVPATRHTKPCQAAGCNRPALEVPNASLCGECRDAMRWPEGLRRPVPGDLTVSPALLDRCAAMNLSLLEQARTAYDQGDQAAGQELRWLIETGEQLVAAGGGA